MSVFSSLYSTSLIGVQMSRMNYFLVHLSLADLLTALLTLLPEIAWSLTSPHFWGGRPVCKALKFLQVSWKSLCVCVSGREGFILSTSPSFLDFS